MLRALFRFSCIVSCLLFAYGRSSAQDGGSDAAPPIDNSYAQYLQQLERLYLVHGATPSEIKAILDQYSNLKLESNAQLAEMLSRFYSPSEHVAMLLYFYRDGRLYRNLLEPGRVVHSDSLLISTDSMSHLQKQLLCRPIRNRRHGRPAAA